MQKIRFIAGLLGLLGVALGALGAHLLKGTLEATSPTSLENWKTASLYHMLHAVAIFAAAIVPAAPRLRIAAWFWIIGVFLFSGSLYVYALGGPKFLVAVTPLGGVFLMIGWIWVGWSAVRREVP